MGPETWNTKDLLKVTTLYLEKKGIESPRLTAEILLAHQLRTDRVSLYLHFDQPLTEAEVSGYRSFIRRRVAHEPVQYITGRREFWSLEFIVDRRVLIPRPETELLVETALEKIQSGGDLRDASPFVLDLGTGAGPIAIALAKEVPHARIVATDISADALHVARQNALRHGVSDRVTFLCGDLWDALGPREKKGLSFDFILTNPPYVATEDFPDLPPEIRLFEPRQALDGRVGGTYYLERVIREGPPFLRPGGWLIVEMAPEQTEGSLRLAEGMKEYRECSRIRDYSGRYRLVAVRKHE
jgi:release factor glutamine methyltransferase